jgi:RNA polymerase sigma-70 factor, ECF subfamily
MRRYTVSTAVAQRSDEDLICLYRKATSKADRDLAFSELFLRYRDRVARWCVKFTRDHASANDLAQDVFVRALNGLRNFRGNSGFSTWIYVVARNHCRNVIERRIAEPVYVDPASAIETPDPQWRKPYAAIEAKRMYRAEYRAVMNALTVLEAEVVMLHYGNDLSLREVATTLGLTNKSGAKAYIVSARRKLADLVEQHRERGLKARQSLGRE